MDRRQFVKNVGLGTAAIGAGGILPSCVAGNSENNKAGTPHSRLDSVIKTLIVV